MSDNFGANPFDAFLHELFGYDNAARAYDAQRNAFYPNIEFAEGQKLPPEFPSSQAAQDFARSVQSSDYAAKHWPKFHKAKPVVLKILDTTVLGHQPSMMGATHTQDLSISINQTMGAAMSKNTVLHELAHVIDSYEHGVFHPQEPWTEPNGKSGRGLWVVPDDLSGHGPRWAGTFLTLVREFMTKSDADKLLEMYVEYGVRYANLP